MCLLKFCPQSRHCVRIQSGFCSNSLSISHCCKYIGDLRVKKLLPCYTVTTPKVAPLFTPSLVFISSSFFFCSFQHLLFCFCCFGSFRFVHQQITTSMTQMFLSYKMDLQPYLLSQQHHRHSALSSNRLVFFSQGNFKYILCSRGGKYLIFQAPKEGFSE